MRIDGPSNPYHISQAYGVSPQSRVARPAPTTAASQVQRADAVSRADTVATIGRAAETTKVAPTSKLVAAVVPGGVDFTAATPMPSRAALQMYRHPADRNSAATMVALGRSVDVNG